MTDVLQMDLLGRGVNWSDSNGYHEGVIVAIALDHRGEFVTMVNMGNRLIQKRLTELTLR